MGGNRGWHKIFGVECCVTLHCNWPILKMRKIGGTELGTGWSGFCFFLFFVKFAVYS